MLNACPVFQRVVKISFIVWHFQVCMPQAGLGHPKLALNYQSMAGYVNHSHWEHDSYCEIISNLSLK